MRVPKTSGNVALAGDCPSESEDLRAGYLRKGLVLRPTQVVVTDVSGRKRLEARLRAAADESRGLYAAALAISSESDLAEHDRLLD